MDTCLQQLLPHLGSAGRRLWIADEQVDASAAGFAPAGICAITNRCDVQALLQARGIDCALNDFDLGAFGEAPFDTIGFRVAKEKAVVHHVINSALRRLRPGGWLWLAGEKNDGIRTHIDKAVDYAGALVQLERDGPRRLWIGVWSENLGAQRFYERHGFHRVGEYEFPVGRVLDLEFILCREASAQPADRPRSEAA